MTGTAPETDLLVVGAGFAGLYTVIHGLRAGLSVAGIDAATDVGGTWYWNRYPGARCDVESVDYSFSFDPQLEAEWRWTERYATQPEILSYLSHVADRYDVRRHYAFGERMTSARWNDEAMCWSVTTDAGVTRTARWLVMASGSLSAPHVPAIPGIESFAGRVVLTADWPREGVELAGKRVGVIGTGSSGVQSIPLIAQQAAALTVFQRTANYSVPAFNRPVDDDEWATLRAGHAERRVVSWASSAGSPWTSHPVPYEDLSDAEREEVLEESWQRGGVLFAKAFARQTSDPVINDAARVFFERKLSQIIDDVQLRADLTPTDHPIGTKRICTDTGYYETFTQPHVRLVNLRRDPIRTVTPTGVTTESAHHELDVLVFATGFDAMTGALTGPDIVGRGGRVLRDQWADGPSTLLGVAIPGFPNLFSLNGPGSPSVLSNMALGSEQQADYALRLVQQCRDQGYTSIEARDDAANDWTDHVADVARSTLFADAPSWYAGANIPGKKRVFTPYIGGFAPYIERCEAVAADGYPGFIFSER